MNGLEVFIYADQEVRTILIDGEPWFVASDVCAVLGIVNARDALGRLDPDEKGVGIADTPGGRQHVGIVSEAGVYGLTWTSRKDEAAGFRRWLKHDVLPSIRRTGSYGTPVPHALPQSYAEALRELADTAERAQAAEAQVAVLTPAAEAWDDLASAGGDFTITDAAKVLARGGVSTGPIKLHTYLKDDAGWIFRRGERWQAMQTAINAGYVVERITGGYFDSDGVRQQGKPQVRLTATGIQKLHDLMRVSTAPAAVLHLPTNRNA